MNIFLSLTGAPSVHREQILYVRFAFFQTVAGNFYLFCITDFSLAHGYLKRWVDDMLAHSFHRHYVLTDLPRREWNTWKRERLSIKCKVHSPRVSNPENYIPKLPFTRRFKKQGSSRPLGAWIDAFNSRKSLSSTLPGNDTSLHEPTDIWFLFRPSPIQGYKNKNIHFRLNIIYKAG